MVNGEAGPGLIQGVARGDAQPVFAFPGAGCQWFGMGIELQRSSALFRGDVQECVNALEQHTDVSAPYLDPLCGRIESGDWERPEVHQPAQFAVMVALARLWQRFGVVPGAVVGQCTGEIAAAHVSGALSLEQAARCMAVAARAQQRVAAQGDMAAVQLPVGALMEKLARWDGRLVFAGEHGPSSVVVSGERAARDELIADLRSENIRATVVRTGAPTHSPFMEAVREQVLRELDGISGHDSAVPFYSAVTGGLLRPGDLGAEYWYRNLRQPMRFREAVEALSAAGHTSFVEISPHPSLTGALQETLEEAGTTPLVVGSIGREAGGMDRLLRSLAEAWVGGVRVRWDAVFSERSGSLDEASPQEAHPVTLGTEHISAAAGRGTPGSSHQEQPVAAASADEDRDPVAIVAMACRLPGDVDSPEELWEMLAAGGEGIGGLPENRGWDLEGRYDPDPAKAGTFYVRKGGFLRDAAGFDAELFAISPREAMAMHPQQRLLLETSWEACERALIDPGSLRGTDTAVFAGVFAVEYGPRMHEGGSGADGHLLTGSTASVASGRISYALGLRGPAVSVDTACSSSLAAVHLAAQSLRRGECSLALAGGATVLGTPGLLVDFSRQQVLAADGRSRAFSDDAAGFGAAEGAVMLLLERLSDAVRNGHPVLAVVRGSAWNQDGASEGLTAPNQDAQEDVIRLALADARLQAHEVDLIEAHGTGTKVGDPVEARALLATYGQQRPTGQPAYLGSVKTNIGHTMAASGGVGVIKAVLALRHERMPATLHAEVPSTAVPWGSGQIELLSQARDWPATGSLRRAGILGYGISGTNVHLIIEEAPRPGPHTERSAANEFTGPLPWALYGATPAALRAQAGKLLAHLDTHPELSVPDVGWTLASTRALLPHRALVTGQRPDLLDGLRALSKGETSPHLACTRALDAPRPVFVFPGQGSQWAGMARELLETSPLFTSRMEECAQALAPYTDWSLMDVLREVPGAPGLDRVDVVQPVLFASMVSLAALWRGNGVEPDAVVGHSQGEIAAACVAGALSLQDAAKIVALRSQALLKLSGKGAMATVALPRAEAEKWLIPWQGRVSIAAVNGPSSTLVSGEAEAMEEVLAAWESDGVWARRVAVDYASHSPQVDALREELHGALGEVRARTSRIPFFSTVTGDLLDTALLDAEYWFSNLRRPVRLHETVRAVLRHGYGALIEVSAHPVLTMGMQETVEEAPESAVVLDTLRRDEGGSGHFLRALAQAHTHGVAVDWSAVFDGTGARKVALPTYAFQHQRFWFDAPTGTGAGIAAAGLESAEHPLLDVQTELAHTGGFLLTGRLSTRTHPWLADHAVRGTTLMPGTAFLELVFKAATLVGFELIDELILEAPLVVTDDAYSQLQLTITPPQDDGTRQIHVHSRPENAERDIPWTRHATGILSAQADPAASAYADDGSWPPPEAERIDLDGFYERLTARGYEYGPAFRNLRALWRQEDTVWAEVALEEEAHAEAERFYLHPALLDAALHSLLAEDTDRLVMPFSWQQVRLEALAASQLRVRLTHSGTDTVTVKAIDPTGTPVFQAEALTVRTLAPESLRMPTRGEKGLLRPSWKQVTLTEDPQNALWLLAAPGPQLHTALTAGHFDAEQRSDLTAVRDALAANPRAGAVAVLVCAPVPPEHGAAGVHDSVSQTLQALQMWLADERCAGTPLIVLTHGAVSTRVPQDVPALAQAALWGLVRTAQSEHPGRITLVDWDEEDSSLHALRNVTASPEPQFALREGTAYVPRLAKVTTTSALVPPAPAADWKLQLGTTGALDGLSLAPLPEASAALAPGEVRVAVRAAGLNFRDVLLALDMVVPNSFGHGFEGAGTVTETAPDVTTLTVGDKVYGLFGTTTAFATQAITDHRLLTLMPEDSWTFDEAASIPAAFLTAYYTLVSLADLKPQEKVLIHAGAGGVGMAAVQLAQHLGAEVFATAAPHKWHALRALGLDERHLASSRDLDFEQTFLRETDGSGMDVVLNSLAGEFIDASVRLLPRGGRFLEMGKTDVREPQDVARNHPGVSYTALDLAEAGEDHLRDMLAELTQLFRHGRLHPLPVTSWDIRRAPEAFASMSQAQHIGKNVLTLPRPLNPEGTVLITGGTGTLGSLIARHLVNGHGARHLLLASRSGPDAPGATELAEELTAAGAHVGITACDVSEPDELSALLADIPAEHPLTGVIHTAGTADDAVITSLTPQQVTEVLRPKVDAALNLHEQTQKLDLPLFVLYSSMAGQLGNGGQANYAAGNTFLDALAHHRRAQGLTATSMAWGLWSQESSITRRLDEAGRQRILGAGLRPFASDQGLDMFDAAMRFDEPVLAAAALDTTALAQRDPESVPSVLRDLIRTPSRRARTARPAASLSDSLTAMPSADQDKELLELVRGLAASVLGHNTTDAVEANRPFREMGFDSLTSVQLRNRLNTASGLRLATTVVFDHPTAHALAKHVADQLGTSGTPGPEPEKLTAAAQEQGHSTLLARFQAAGEDGRTDEGLTLLQAEAQRRPTFARGRATGAALDPVTLAEGETAPRIICFPSPLAPADPLQYARFSRQFEGRRSVSCLRLPGYQAGQRLPASREALVDSLAHAVASCADGSPYVLLGHSAGGWLAHETAHHLGVRDCGPRGVVLLDTGTLAHIGPDVLSEIARTVWADGAEVRPDSAALTAMGWYFKLFSNWTPSPATTPTHWVQAQETILGHTAEWPEYRTHTTTPGNHLTMMGEHARTTGDCVEAWLIEHAEMAPPSGD
ncbi:SDR family NAD(P)-dependent oxidoreductase [Streptomyces sp. NPDC051546]|uniref:SDR family NAD(P)-dependent oxidoreductase n=1 Tax=Streptomyces sp. NPDC051546 TaxID=3365655 RepID=UPI0037AA49A8